MDIIKNAILTNQFPLGLLVFVFYGKLWILSTSLINLITVEFSLPSVFVIGSPDNVVWTLCSDNVVLISYSAFTSASLRGLNQCHIHVSVVVRKISVGSLVSGRDFVCLSFSSSDFLPISFVKSMMFLSLGVSMMSSSITKKERNWVWTYTVFFVWFICCRGIFWMLLKNLTIVLK